MRRLQKVADLSADKNTAQTVLNDITQINQSLQNLSQQMDEAFNGIKGLMYDQSGTAAKAPFNQWQQQTDTDWKQLSDAWNSVTTLKNNFNGIVTKVTAICNVVTNQQDNSQPPAGF